jgi:hypothetical protein
VELLIGLLLALAASTIPVSASQPDRPQRAIDRADTSSQSAPQAPSQGELTQSAIDLFILSKPPCKVADFEFIVKPKMVVATCDADATGDVDFAGMFLIDGRWQPGIYDTGR